eukprot:gene3780-7506_t
MSIAMVSETSTEVEEWRALLNSKPVLWVEGVFIKPTRLAFEALAGIDANSFPFCVHDDLLEHRNLLLSLDSKRIWFICWQTCSRNTIIFLFPSLCWVRVWAYSRSFPDYGTMICLALKGKTETSPIETPLADEKQEVPNLESNDDIETTNDLSALWPIFMSDQSGLLVPSTSLTFNDAPWISPLAFSHWQRGIGAADAKLFGCHGLCHQLFSEDQVACASPQFLRSLIDDDSVLDALGSLISMADTYGASSVHMLYDGRQHPTSSLMYPGMCSPCGPSLVMYFDGVVLGTESITQAFSCSVRVPSVTESMNSGEGNSLTGDSKSVDTSTSSSSSSLSYCNAGKQMSVAFALTDCVQILSGRYFYVLDPCGTHLTASLEDSTDITTETATTTKTMTTNNSNSEASQHPPMGHKCLIAGEASRETLFPNQFTPLFSLPLGGGKQNTLKNCGEVPGTFLRLEMRKSPSPISDEVVSEEDIRTALHMLKGNLEGALLLGSGVLQASMMYVRMRATISHWLEGADKCKTDLELIAMEASSDRKERLQSRL